MRALALDFRVLLHVSGEKPSDDIEQARELAARIEAVLKDFDSHAFTINDLRWVAP